MHRLVTKCHYLYPLDVLTETYSLLTSTIFYVDHFHAGHSIAVTVVMYHMTYELWRSSEKTALDSSGMHRCQKNDLASKYR